MSLNPVADPTQTPYNITVTATMGSITDSMQIQVVPPTAIDPNTFPVINGVSPSVGGTQGGYFAVLKGLRLGGTQTVLIDDVPTTFVQNTNNEVTIVIPGRNVGVVDIVLITNAGQATAKFQYD